jgi:hypothetical protein
VSLVSNFIMIAFARGHQEANGHCSAGGGGCGEQFDQEPRGRGHFNGKILREKGADDQGSALQQKKREGIEDVTPDDPVKAKISRLRDSLLAQNKPVPPNRDRCQER